MSSKTPDTCLGHTENDQQMVGTVVEQRSRAKPVHWMTERQGDKIRGETTSKKLWWFKREMATGCVTLGRLPAHCDPQFYHPFWQWE